MKTRQQMYRILQYLIQLCLRNQLSARWLWPKMARIRSIFAIEKTLVTNFDYNIKILTNLSDHIESQIFWQGVQEGDRGEMKLLGEILRPDHIFFDIGANVGVFSLFAAKRTYNGQVHAFEPYYVHLSRFRSNCALNKFDNITVNDFGLLNARANQPLYVPNSNNTGMASVYDLSNESCRTSEYTAEFNILDEYITENSIPTVDIIKIDVEGAELDVLEGGISSLRKFTPTVVMELDQEHLKRAGRTSIAVLQFWQRLNYAIYRIEHDGSLEQIVSASQFNDHQNIYCKPV